MDEPRGRRRTKGNRTQRKASLPPEAFYEQIVDSLSSGVIAFDGNGVIIMVNRAAREHLGVAEDQLHKGMRLEALLLIKPFVEVMQSVLTTHETVSRREIVIAHPDGSKREIGFSVSLLAGPNPFNGAVFLFVDMTERRLLERAAELNRQLAQIGELTAGVVHELRNPLQVISGMAELLQRRIEPNDPRHRNVVAIVNETKNLERLISQFLGFAKPFHPETDACRPEAIVERTLALCEARAGDKRVTLAKQIGEPMPEIYADANMLVQAIVNIVNNAIDAVPDGGHVTVSARHDGPDMVFDVTDNGPGVYLQPGEDLFKPFFSRKAGGTGLGLAICHRIITAHAGSVTFANRTEGGALFSARVPIQKGGLG
jgi:two-component system nitrogen regulation sensor histidine kinase GlnL